MWKTAALCLVMAFPLWGGVADVPHPRLWMTKGGEVAVVKKIKEDPLAMRLHEVVMREADRILAERTCRYEIPDGRRLLRESRLALHNISHCAWAWRFSGEDKYRQRVIREMEAACALKDWNPPHFLDTAEMALAVAWGYDWIHGTLSAEQRKVFEDALLEKGLRVADEAYRKEAWWARPKNNWAQVCGGGIGVAAVAVAERDPELADRLLDKGLRLVEACHAFYQPDGMYPEGPGYWHYGTNYHVMMLSASESLRVPYREDTGLARSGLAVMHLTSPTRYSFNFADAAARKEMPSPAQSWIARRYADCVQAAHVRRLFERAMKEEGDSFALAGYGPLSVLWLPDDPGKTELPLHAVFRGEQAVAAFRTSWEPGGVWFAMKGGLPGASHGQMDVGSFVYDAHGERWIHDMGPENYNLPGYFGSKRWEYFRSQSRSHNTLEIGGRLQKAQAAPCPLVMEEREGKLFRAEFDLSNAYAGAAKSVRRKVEFDSEVGMVRLRDEVVAPSGEIIWRAFTDAKVEVAGAAVVLRKNGKAVALHNRGDSGVWSVGSAAPKNAAENQNDGYVEIALTVKSEPKAKIDVEIRPSL